MTAGTEEETEGSNIGETGNIEDLMATAEEEEDLTLEVVIGNEGNMFILARSLAI